MICPVCRKHYIKDESEAKEVRERIGCLLEIGQAAENIDKVSVIEAIIWAEIKDTEIMKSMIINAIKLANAAR